MPRLPSYAVSLVAAVALVAGCSGTPEPSPRPAGDRSAAEDFRAPELEGDGAGADNDRSAGGAPEFSGRRPLTIVEARRDVVDEPCTANAIERLCGSSARFVLVPVGDPTPVTLTGATTTTESSGLTWRVRLEFAAADAPLPRVPGGAVQVLEGADRLQVEVGEGADVGDRTVLLTGLEKRGAWGLVDRLAER